VNWGQYTSRMKFLLRGWEGREVWGGCGGGVVLKGVSGEKLSTFFVAYALRQRGKEKILKTLHL